MPALLRCTDVCQDYRIGQREVPALRGVSAGFAPGRITTIAGPSGSGKSTLLRVLACIDRPRSGSVVLDGVELTTLGRRSSRAVRRHRLAYLFQNPADNLVEYLDASAQVRLAADFRGAAMPEPQIVGLLDSLGLAHRADHRPFQLSGGEQQRLAIACAVAGHTDVVLADEPTAELDSTSAGVVLEAFHVLRDAGRTVVLSSHDPAVLAASDHVLRLDHGTVVATS